MASTLKRVSVDTERAITALANRESRTFVAQLDIVAEAGLKALGEPTIAELAATITEDDPDSPE